MNYLKTFAAIIAVLEDTPPNCVVVKIETQCLEVLSHLSHKSGVSIYIQDDIKWRRLDSAATLRLCSTQLGLDKHYAAVIIKNEIKTKICKFPRSHTDHFYDL